MEVHGSEVRPSMLSLMQSRAEPRMGKFSRIQTGKYQICYRNGAARQWGVGHPTARAADCLGPSRIAGREQERPVPYDVYFVAFFSRYVQRASLWQTHPYGNLCTKG